MSAESKNSNDQATATELPGGGNIDNIREILFGAQMRLYEKRFQRMEKLLAKECSDLRDEMERRLDSLETFVKQEYEALGDRVSVEQDERTVAVKDLTKELNTLSRDTDKRSGRLEERLQKGLKDLREKVLAQSKSLTNEIRDKNDSLNSGLNSHIEELRTEKTDRAALVALFTEMALRLKEEFRLPGSDEA